MATIDDDDDYLSPLFEMDWKEIQNIIRKQKIERIYGNLGQSFKRDTESDSKGS